MPFTFSHPAIVLPLKKMKASWFSSTGLVIGSIAPDLPYFVTMDAQTNIGHTFIGIFIIDLPISFLVAIAFHLWVRNNLIMHLPSPLDRKYYDYTKFDFLYYLKQKWFVIAVSILIGIISHLIWDDFTKPDGVVYYFNPSFFKQIIHIGPLNTHLYRLIERTGSVLGLLLLMWIIFQKKEQVLTPSLLSDKKKSVYWLVIILCMIFMIGIKLTIDQENKSIGQLVVIFTSAALLALCFTSVVYLLRPEKQNFNG